MVGGRATRYLAREIASGLAAPVTNRIADVADVGVVGLDAKDAAMRVYRSTRGVRAANGPRVGVIVSGEWFHGGSDRKNALAQLGIDFAALQNDITASKADPAWIAADVAPVLAEWHNFIVHMAASSVAPYVTEWSVYESWSERLRRLRELARAHGVALASAEPAPLPQTVWERGSKGTGGPLDSWIALGKTVVFGAMAFTGLVAFYSIMRDLHGRVSGGKRA